MELNKKLIAIVSCMLLLVGVIALGGDTPRLAAPHSVTLPAQVILDQETTPLLAANGKAGFVTSPIDGSLISFSAVSGKLFSSVVVGEGAGVASMVEVGGRRLIAVPCANDPGKTQSATISMVDATRFRDLQIVGLLMLPADAQITSSTSALLTSDGRFVLIASSFDNPTLYSFSLETGQVVSSAQIVGRPSQIALKDTGPDDTARMVAVVSSIAGAVTMIGMNPDGVLAPAATFSPSGANFDASNNPAFGQDGKTLYVAAGSGNQLFAVDSATGAEISSLQIDSPERITVAQNGDQDMIAVTRIRRPASGKPGGVTVAANPGGRLAIRSDFSLPDQIDLARTNNVVFAKDPSVAFVSSASGFLFAFNAETGQKVADQQITGEPMRMSISSRAQTLAAISRTQAGDQIIVVQFDLASPDAAADASGDTAGAAAPTGPSIESFSPAAVNRGQMRDVPLAIRGANFASGASLVLNGAQMHPGLVRNASTMVARLPRSLFDKAGEISVQVKSPGGSVSKPVVIRVVESDAAPVITGVKPGGFPTSTPVTLWVTGVNFRASSVVVVNKEPLNTTLSQDAKRLFATVPAKLTHTPGNVSVQVQDSNLVSNPENVTAFGPMITGINPHSNPVAGAGGVRIVINGQYFSGKVSVQVSGKSIPETGVQIINDHLIKATVPSRFISTAGAIPVTVTNGDGNISNSSPLNALGPQVSSVAPGTLVAGVSTAKVTIRGANFRVHSNVLISTSGSTTVPSQLSVRFVSTSQISVLLRDASAGILSQPGTLNIQVVNPNSSTGNLSETQQINVVGPNVIAVSKAPAADGFSTITISGQFFRHRARVRFLMADLVVLQLRPDTVTPKQIVLTLTDQQITVLGLQYQVQVVNPGGITSNAFSPSKPDESSHAPPRERRFELTDSRQCCLTKEAIRFSSVFLTSLGALEQAESRLAGRHRLGC
ncbi:MAG TPA: IPT/TIG domain-containing protein [Blastocatellia bacterium]|nr:IPT/TIG domain-containing protein [Blastocatellia bacterium]